MTLYQQNRAFREALLRQERGAAREMAQAYGESWLRIKKQLDALLKKLGEAQAAGQPVSMAWLFQERRLETLQRQVEREMQRWGGDAAREITGLQREAVKIAERQAEVETMAALGTPPPGVALAQVKPSWTRLSREAITDLVGFTTNGTPLRTLLDELGTETGEIVRRELTNGMAVGENPRRIARRVKEAFGGNLVRALRVSRTETMRAYRTAALRSYQANDDVVKGWIWNAACDVRTCAACWKKHGSTHEFSDELNDHPNGRCSRSPWVKTWVELGFEGVPERAPMKSGEERFAELTADEQDKVLGKAGGAAYRDSQRLIEAGQEPRVTLKDFATTKTSAAWGTHVQRKSLMGALGEEEAKRWERIADAINAPGRSRQPVDRMIRGLAAQGRAPTDDEWEEIRGHIGRASFYEHEERVPVGLRGMLVEGQPLGEKATSLRVHWAKRVVREAQWTNTSPREYLSDLSRACASPNADCAIYKRRGGVMVAIEARTAEIVAPGRLGRSAEKLLYVFYSADRGTIVSGYQATGRAVVSIPPEAIWKQR